MTKLKQEITKYFNDFLEVHPQLKEEGALTEDEAVQDICDIVERTITNNI